MATARVQKPADVRSPSRSSARPSEPAKTPDDIRVELLEVEVEARRLTNVAYKLALFWACVFAALTVFLVLHAAYAPHRAQIVLPLVTGPSGLASVAIAWVAGRRLRSPWCTNQPDPIEKASSRESPR